MKNALVAIIFIIGGFNGISQTDESNLGIDNFRHHEVGLDATGFIKYFTNILNLDDAVQPVSIYQFTYRFKTRKFGNIRFGAGGNYNEREFQNFFQGDSTVRTRMSNGVSVRIGWEYHTEISKRWEAFYGIDFRPTFSYFRDDAIGYEYSQIDPWNNTIAYVVGQEVKSKTMGVAPLLGFRFKVTPRLSLTSEASFSVNFQENSTRTYYSIFDNAVAKEDFKTNLKNTFGSFNAPLSIILTFDL
ncbi:MAG: hypothetical protein AB8B74_07505 [Crocinitomicaceae bacterium]